MNLENFGNKRNFYEIKNYRLLILGLCTSVGVCPRPGGTSDVQCRGLAKGLSTFLTVCLFIYHYQWRRQIWGTGTRAPLD